MGLRLIAVLMLCACGPGATDTDGGDPRWPPVGSYPEWETPKLTGIGPFERELLHRIPLEQVGTYQPNWDVEASMAVDFVRLGFACEHTTYGVIVARWDLDRWHAATHAALLTRRQYVDGQVTGWHAQDLDLEPLGAY